MTSPPEWLKSEIARVEGDVSICLSNEKGERFDVTITRAGACALAACVEKAARDRKGADAVYVLHHLRRSR